MADDDYAIAAGITFYPSLGNLNGPENDAVLFHQWLVDRQGGCLPASNVQLVLSSEHFDPAENDPYKARPTTEEVDAAFGRLVEEGIESGGHLGRRLYIFLAGHGFGPDVEEAALLMANASKLRTGHHVPGRRYANWFRTAAMFDEIVLFMDTCRDDYRRAPLRLPPWVEIRSPQAARVRYFYGFATRWSRKARERILLETGLVNGVFTTALVAALRNSPADPNGQITGSSVASYVYNYLPRLVDEDEYQEPEFDYDKQFDFVFTTRLEPALTRLRLHFTTPDPAHSAEILDHSFQTVASLAPLVPIWEIALPPGRYMVIRSGSGTRKVIDVIGTEVIDETI
jgi:hypothetical protein